MTESLPARETLRVGWGSGVGQLLTLLCGFDSDEQVGQRGVYPGPRVSGTGREVGPALAHAHVLATVG